jgi:TPR repeat protein
MTFINKTFIACLILFLYQPTVHAVSYKDGVYAYNKQHYHQAHQIWLTVIKETPVSDKFKWNNTNLTEVTNAQHSLGILYWECKGVVQNYKKAQYWLKFAALQDIPDAQLKLAYLHLNGLTGIKDEIQARNWFKKAAELGNSDAQYNLATLYLKGIGGKKDSAHAKYWFTQTQKNGYKKAEQKLAMLNVKPSQPLKQMPAKKPEKIKKPPPETRKKESVLPIATVSKLAKAKYAVQVAAFSKKHSLYSLSKNFPSSFEWYFFLKKRGHQHLYILLNCCFNRHEQAIRAQNKIDSIRKGLKPFVINLESLQ